MLDDARRATGLVDFGPGGFRLGLTRLLESLTFEAHLKPSVIPVARKKIHDLLCRRLVVQDWLKHHDEVREESIDAPIFIVGFPRSGSSILHELWSLDSQTRHPLAWEVHNPVPPPEAATYQVDPRIAQSAQAFEEVRASRTTRTVVHREGPTLPAEDAEITQLEFANVLSVRFYVPSFTRWIFQEIDYRPVYGALRSFLQLLQSRCRRGPWVLKSLYSTNHVAALMTAFPDARVVWLHRDPIVATASAAHLIQMAALGSSDRVTARQLATDVARWRVAQADAAVQVARAGAIAPSRRFDVNYDELIADPIRMLGRIYRHFDLDLWPGLAERMRRYLAANGPDSVRHDYTFDETGLDRDKYEELFETYVCYFHL